MAGAVRKLALSSAESRYGPSEMETDWREFQRQALQVGVAPANVG